MVFRASSNNTMVFRHGTIWKCLTQRHRNDDFNRLHHYNCHSYQMPCDSYQLPSRFHHGRHLDHRPLHDGLPRLGHHNPSLNANLQHITREHHIHRLHNPSPYNHSMPTYRNELPRVLHKGGNKHLRALHHRLPRQCSIVSASDVVIFHASGSRPRYRHPCVYDASTISIWK